MKVLVLGAGGIIGCNLVKVLSDAGVQVSGVVASNDPPKELMGVADWYKVTECDINKLLVVANWDLVVDLRAHNVSDVKDILEGHSIHYHCKWLNISTMYVYRNFSLSNYENRAEEDALRESDICTPDGPYGLGKYEVEQYLKEIATPSFKTLSLRIPFVVGEYDRTVRVFSYVDRINKELPVSLNADGARIVELIPARVLAKIILEISLVSDFSLLSPVLNVAVKNKLTLREHLAIIAQSLGKKLFTENIYIERPSARTGLSFFADICIDSTLLEHHLGHPVEVSWEYEWRRIVSQTKMYSLQKEHYEKRLQC